MRRPGLGTDKPYTDPQKSTYNTQKGNCRIEKRKNVGMLPLNGFTVGGVAGRFRRHALPLDTMTVTD